ncbi:DNA-binding protein [Mycobacteroides abscessus]|uniref:helix-turn-helix domain-containing protein n=1 Tax=Mycobacteroides abscessus TaxID=36809 RepID=UPI000C25911D|nr:helix-turn-helix domain-containing protein [Mycobacteroides abscessus]AWG64204.1 DNA-binding protein [Mycobacteroides abscessus]MDO3110033.1 helix-turn-helix domain-containing protein [Mycobacteroides abscessus subsp. abscessus]RIS02886.1 DNA-binding protein [Mycobacteroides abscessus]
MSARIETYSLAQVVADVLPEEWTDGERWLRRRLNRGEIEGYKVGREWRFTKAQVDALIAHFTNAKTEVAGPAEETESPLALGLSARSRRRLVNA